VAHYIDTSALVKLVVREAETDAFREWLAAGREPVASDLVRTELLRAARRVSPDLVLRARSVLDAITLIQLSTTTFESAALLDPALLRSLDALHLAAALELGDDLEGFVTYDDRLAESARHHGIPVVAPS
jgi:uncharacterized protein